MSLNGGNAIRRFNYSAPGQQAPNMAGIASISAPPPQPNVLQPPPSSGNQFYQMPQPTQNSAPPHQQQHNGMNPVSRPVANVQSTQQQRDVPPAQPSLLQTPQPKPAVPQTATVHGRPRQATILNGAGRGKAVYPGSSNFVDSTLQ